MWSYVATTPPVVSGVSPAVGTTGGGTAVVIRGSGFAPTGIDAVSSVTFAGVPATSFHVVSLHPDRRRRTPARCGGGRRDRDRARRDHADHRSRPVPLRRRPARPDEGRREGRQPPSHGHLQAAVRDRPRHLPGHRVAGRRARRRRKHSPITVRGPAQRPAVSVPRARHQRRRHESLLAVDACGDALRAAAAVARIDPRDSAERAAHRLHRLGGPPLAQARLARRETAARAALRCARDSPGTCSSAGARRAGRSRFRRGVLTIRLKRPARRIAVSIAAPGVSATASLARAVKRRRAGRLTLTPDDRRRGAQPDHAQAAPPSVLTGAAHPGRRREAQRCNGARSGERTGSLGGSARPARTQRLASVLAETEARLLGIGQGHPAAGGGGRRRIGTASADPLPHRHQRRPVCRRAGDTTAPGRASGPGG